jgi:hypothetical protein
MDENKNIIYTNESIVLKPMNNELGIGIVINGLNKNKDKIENVNTIYQKIDSQYRYKIDIFITKEEHYEDV